MSVRPYPLPLTGGRVAWVCANGHTHWTEATAEACSCPWSSVEECAMAAERAVAGTAAPIPGCAVHGR